MRPGGPPLSCQRPPEDGLGGGRLLVFCSLGRVGHEFWRTAHPVRNVHARVLRGISLMLISWNFQGLQRTESHRCLWGAPLEDVKTKSCEVGWRRQPRRERDRREQRMTKEKGESREWKGGELGGHLGGFSGWVRGPQLLTLSPPTLHCSAPKYISMEIAKRRQAFAPLASFPRKG